MHKSAYKFFPIFALITIGGCASNAEMAADHYKSCMQAGLGTGYCTKSAQDLKDSLDQHDARMAKIQAEADARRRKEQEEFDRSDTNKALNSIGNLIEAIAIGRSEAAASAKANVNVSPGFAPGNATYCLRSQPSEQKARILLTNTCAFVVTVYMCEPIERGAAFSCSGSFSYSGKFLPNQSRKFPAKFGPQMQRANYGACKGPRTLQGSFFIRDGVLPDCEGSDVYTGRGGTAN